MNEIPLISSAARSPERTKANKQIKTVPPSLNQTNETLFLDRDLDNTRKPPKNYESLEKYQTRGRESLESQIFKNKNPDLLHRSLFLWTLGFGLVRLYQLELGL